MMKTIILSILLSVSGFTATAQKSSFWKDVSWTAKLGYNLGGTAPIGMPAEIRKLNTYKLRSNLAIGLSLEKPLKGRWGVMAGLQYENKGMEEDANVKNYHEAIVRGGEKLEGKYTGDVTTKVDEWMLTVPVNATYHLGKFRLRMGPYLSYLVQKSFEGNAHDGYLRVGNPTGPKVIIGNDESTSGSYDFSSDMRRLQWGLSAGTDWQAFKKWGFYAELNWGMSGIFKGDFHTVENTLYPIFGSFGVVYKFK